MRPSIGFASLKLLKDATGIVGIPEAQTCCGQPAFNNGADNHAGEIVKQVIAAFEYFDYVVVRSGSCGGMLKVHSKELFLDEPEWSERHTSLAQKTYKIMSYLTNAMDFTPKGVAARAQRFIMTRARGCQS